MFGSLVSLRKIFTLPGNFFYSEETVIYNNGDCIFSEMYFETCIMINKHICLKFTRRKFSVFFTGINIY